MGYGETGALAKTSLPSFNNPAQRDFGWKKWNALYDYF